LEESLDRASKAKKHSQQPHYQVTLIFKKLPLFFWLIEHSSGIIGKHNSLHAVLRSGERHVDLAKDTLMSRLVPAG
jgi:hypothetical protein